jgi:hypothetical protein
LKLLVVGWSRALLGEEEIKVEFEGENDNKSSGAVPRFGETREGDAKELRWARGVSKAMGESTV